MAQMPLRHGTHAPLEEAANEMLRVALRGVRHVEHDVLTPWKEADRRRRELYVASGTPDAAVRQGCFYRALNTARPELNSRDGIARSRTGGGRFGGGGLAEHAGGDGHRPDGED
jgi:hypothetical protein